MQFPVLMPQRIRKFIKKHWEGLEKADQAVVQQKMDAISEKQDQFLLFLAKKGILQRIMGKMARKKRENQEKNMKKAENAEAILNLWEK